MIYYVQERMILYKPNNKHTSVSIATLLSLALAITLSIPGSATAANAQAQTSKTTTGSSVIDKIATTINKLFPTETSTIPQIPESDLASLTQPGVVRIVQHSVGKIYPRATL